MTDSLAHRGPDGRGTWSEHSIGLGHRRLSIRDLSPNGTQPFFSSCGRAVVTYNGEIYNDRRLTDELRRDHGFVRRTGTDTEILPAGWLAWGLGLLDRLEGMFAFALWDSKARRLILARDHFGIKPLYFADDGVTVRFASEPKALLQDPAFSPTISAHSVAAVLSLGYPGPEQSLFNQIKQVAPGTAIIIDRFGSTAHRYWKQRRNPATTSLDQACKDFSGLFRSVVSDQLVSDVPVAALQSGGIDSALISLSLPRQADVSLYNVSFPERSFDEANHAKDLARSVGRSITFLDGEALNAEEDFRAVVHSVDGALGDSSALAMYQLCREVRRNVRAALSGDGGDEVFGGYPTYRATAITARIQHILPSVAWRRLAQHFAITPPRLTAPIGMSEMLSRLFYGLSRPVPHTGWRYYLPDWDHVGLYGPELLSLEDHDPLEGYANAFTAAEGNVWDRSLLADQNYYLPADMLLKVDRTSMAHGLEVRVPFLDRRVVDFAGSLDRHLLATRYGATKIVLRRTAARMGAPKSITCAPKRGFRVPMNRLLRKDLHALADRILDREADILLPFCTPDGVRRIWREHRDQCIDRKYVVWTLMTLAVWRQETGI